MDQTPQPVAVVTGASAGIGRATALELAARGFAVILTYRSHPEGADTAVDTIRERGGRAVALPLDVAHSGTFPEFVDQVRGALDGWGAPSVHALVNNAGFGGGAPFAEITEEHLDRYYRVLFRGPYLLTQALLPLLADGGAIVTTASSSAWPGDTEPGYSAYAAMKGAVVVAARYLAKELSPRGIRVTTVSPGPTRTRLGDDAFERFPQVVDQLAGRTALGRIAEPEDVARVIAFLASDDGAWITAEDVQVTGGYAL